MVFGEEMIYEHDGGNRRGAPSDQTICCCRVTCAHVSLSCFCFVDGDQLGRHVNEMPLFLSSRYPCSFARTQAEVTPSSSGTNLSSHGSADIRISQGLDHRLERLGH